MKILIPYVFLLCMFGCNEGHCPNEISQYNQKIKYTIGDILIFKDSLSNIKYDTVTFVNIDEPDYDRYLKAKEDGKEYQYKGRGCEANTFVAFSNLFYIRIYSNANVKIEGLLGYMEPGGYGYWNWSWYTFNYLYDTINYKYNNKIYKAMKYSLYDDTLNSHIRQVQNRLTKQNQYIYHDYTFIYEDEIKLVEYTTMDSLGNKRKWRLQE